MASVRLNFSPPIEQGITKLYIFEAADQAGPWDEIEVVTSVGAYPEYISHYTTDQASSGVSWFRIRWEDNKGAMTDYSEAVQGGTETVVGELVEMVMLRDPTINENVAMQEIEAVLDLVFHDQDPELSPSQKSGVVMLAMARVYLTKVTTQSTASEWTAALVSMKVGDTQQGKANVEWLLKEASKSLGMSFSVVAQMAELEIPGLTPSVNGFDPSRLLVEIE